jgi:hypothetical protein
MARTLGKVPQAVVMSEPVWQAFWRCPEVADDIRVAHMNFDGESTAMARYLGMWMFVSDDERSFSLRERVHLDGDGKFLGVAPARVNPDESLVHAGAPEIHAHIQQALGRYMARTLGGYPCAFELPRTALERLLAWPDALPHTRSTQVPTMSDNTVRLIQYLGMWPVSGDDDDPQLVLYEELPAAVVCVDDEGRGRILRSRDL